MDIKYFSAIAQIDRKLWNSFISNDYPFAKYEFLAALEGAADRTVGQSDHTYTKFVACDSPTGWQANHAVIYKNSEAVALLPNYIKNHSYGEYIFDWSWANAYQQNNIPYYPKLLNAIPFSPVTGPRILTHPNADKSDTLAFVAQSIHAQCEQSGYSSFHSLYLGEQDAQMLSQSGLLQRHSFQYHWHNQNPATSFPYTCFEDYITQLKSRKRKSMQKERRSVVEAGIKFETLEGISISEQHWEVFYQFYQITYAKRSGHGGYLPKAFFKKIGADIPQNIVMVFAKKNNQYIAGSLYLKSNDVLYGRYWGCSQQFEFLHFEACIYQGIEYCIKYGLKKFDAGAQGEHKLHRGFAPVSTWSSHWIQNEQFRTAISRFVTQEKTHNMAYMGEAIQSLPYKNGLSSTTINA